MKNRTTIASAAALVTAALAILTLTGWGCQGPGAPYVAPDSGDGSPDTASWQTFRDETYGVEFKYPEGWMYWENREGTEALRSTAFDADDAEYSNDIGFVISDATVSLDEEMRELDTQGFSVVENSTVTIGGLQWNKLITQQRETPLQFVDYSTERGGKSFTFSSGYAGGSPDGMLNQRNIDALHGILSTFHFVE